MGESRTELLAWVNDLLQLNYTKVEQAGTGAAYCQIMDSIFNDVHMTKVKFDTKHEYEYVSNFKILQHSFDKHKIDKIIPVDKLMKCKFQDNLEFMQWVKRFWDQNFPGGAYDAAQRRKGGGGATSSAKSSPATGRSATSSAMASRTRAPASSTINSGAARTGSRNTAASTMNTGGRVSASRGGAAGGENGAVVNDLKTQITELKVTVDGLEKERDFYFGKLREIEILVQEQLDMTEHETEDTNCIREIQAILYRTEEGFEVPPEGEEEELEEEEDRYHHQEDPYDDETF